MNYEINNAMLFSIRRAIHDRQLNCRFERLIRAIPFPPIPATVSSIPFPEYERTFRQAIDDANRVNHRVSDYLDGLNCQRVNNFVETVRTAWSPEPECVRHPRNGGACRFHAWPGNCDDGLRDMVQPGVMPAGGDGRPADTDGERRSAERHGDDVCGMEHEVRATATPDELNHRSHGYCDGNGPRPRAQVPFPRDYH